MKKKVCIVFIITLLILAISSTSFATEVNTEKYSSIGGSTLGGGNKITKLGGYIFNAVGIVAGGIATIGLIILSIRYMTASADGKADIKKKLIPFLIGAAMVFGVSVVMKIIFDIVSWL